MVQRSTIRPHGRSSQRTILLRPFLVHQPMVLLRKIQKIPNERERTWSRRQKICPANELLVQDGPSTECCCRVCDDFCVGEGKTHVQRKMFCETELSTHQILIAAVPYACGSPAYSTRWRWGGPEARWSMTLRVPPIPDRIQRL